MAESDDLAPRHEEATPAPPVLPPTRGRDQALWVGFFLVLGIIAIFAALYILTDAAFFRGRYIVSTTVPNAGGIRKGDPVQLLGVNIGRIQRFKLDKGQVEIRLELEGEYNVPRDSKVRLKSAGLLGGMVADVEPGEATTFVRNGDRLPGTTEEAVMDQATRIAAKAEKVLAQVEKIFTDQTVKNVVGTADNAQVATADLRRVIRDVSAAVTEQRKQLATLEASLQRSATGVEKITTGPELDRAVKRLDSLSEKMDAVTASLQRSSASVETITARMAKGEGSLGKLTTDDELYRRLNETVDNLNQATVSLNHLVDDVQKNPRKYINLKVF
jgi:phospholipid/cholesterol/gamma-HCH transport system substrate-binding protein